MDRHVTVLVEMLPENLMEIRISVDDSAATKRVRRRDVAMARGNLKRKRIETRKVRIKGNTNRDSSPLLKWKKEWQVKQNRNVVDLN
jgi:hypothetical protein